MPVRVGKVVHVGPEAGADDCAPVDPPLAQALDFLLQVVGSELQARASTGFAAAIRVPGENEVRPLLEDEERTMGVLPLVVGGLWPVTQEARVEVDRAVQVCDVEVDGGDVANVAARERRALGLSGLEPAWRLSRAFFFRCRSFCQRRIALEPRPIRTGTLPAGRPRWHS